MISISIVSHAQNAMVNQLLADLAIIEPHIEYELIITENIADNVEINQAVVRKAIRVIRNTTQRCFASNHNRALMNAKGDYFCVLNPDVRWIQPVFTKLLHHLENDKAEIVAPLVLDFTGVPQDSFRRIPTPSDLFWRRVLHRESAPLPFVWGEFVYPDWIAGIFMLMPAAVFHQLGGFDERYRMYFEDVDFCARASLAGKRIGVDTSIQIQHEGQRSSWKSWRYLFWHASSALRFFTSPFYRQIRSYSNDTK